MQVEGGHVSPGLQRVGGMDLEARQHFQVLQRHRRSCKALSPLKGQGIDWGLLKRTFDGLAQGRPILLPHESFAGLVGVWAGPGVGSQLAQRLRVPGLSRNRAQRVCPVLQARPGLTCPRQHDGNELHLSMHWQLNQEETMKC